MFKHFKYFVRKKRKAIAFFIAPYLNLTKLNPNFLYVPYALGKLNILDIKRLYTSSIIIMENMLTLIIKNVFLLLFLAK